MPERLYRYCMRVKRTYHCPIDMKSGPLTKLDRLHINTLCVIDIVTERREEIKNEMGPGGSRRNLHVIYLHNKLHLLVRPFSL